MPSWSTPPYRPIRPPNPAAKWARSFYYARIDQLPVHPNSDQWTQESINYHRTGFAQQFPNSVALTSGQSAPYYGSRFYNYGPPTSLDHIAFAPFGTDDWDSGKKSGYWVDGWPSGRPYSRSTYAPQGQGYNSTPGPHLWWSDLRQQDASKVGGAYTADFTSGTDKHAILWSEASNELVEVIGYQPPNFLINAPTALSVATWDLTSYNLYVSSNGNPAGAISARIPIAPFFFTYQDLLDCGATGNLGHMLCFSACDYRGDLMWPSRKTDGAALLNGLPAGWPNGAVLRLKSSFDEEAFFSSAAPNVVNGINQGGYGAASGPLKALARTLKTHGIMLIDRNRTRPIMRTVNDPLWPQGTNPTTGLDLGHRLRDAFKFENFEVVDMSVIKVANNSIEVSSYVPPVSIQEDISFRTPAFKPNRTIGWANSFYYQDISNAPVKSSSNEEIAGAINWNDTRGGAAIKLETYGLDDWLSPAPGRPSPIFVDRYPEIPTARYNYTLSGLSPTGTPNSLNLWFPQLRAEGAVSSFSQGSSVNPEGYVFPTSGKRRAIIWGESTVELVEMAGYRTGLPSVDEIVTWDLANYDMAKSNYLGTEYPVGIVEAKIPLAPLMFTYQDLTACGETGDLGHMVGWATNNNSSDFTWPARASAGSLQTANLPCGAVLRLKSDFDINSLPNAPLKALARTLKKYGAILVDNDASSKFIVPADADWPTGTDDLGGQLGAAFTFDKFEVVDMSGFEVDPNNLFSAEPPPPIESTVTADFQSIGEVSGQAPFLATFDASSSTCTDDLEIVQYEWDTGDGDAVYGRSVSVTYPNPGDYDVSLTVKAASVNNEFFPVHRADTYPSGPISTNPVSYGYIQTTAASLVVDSGRTTTQDFIGYGVLNFDTRGVSMEGLRVYGEFSPLTASSQVELGASVCSAASVTVEDRAVGIRLTDYGQVEFVRVDLNTAALTVVETTTLAEVPSGPFVLTMRWIDDETGQTVSVYIDDGNGEVPIFESITNDETLITANSDFAVGLSGSTLIDRVDLATELANRAVYTNVKTINNLIQVAAPIPPIASAVALLSDNPEPLTTITGESPLTVTFDASDSVSTVPITYYSWDFGDGQIGDGPVVSHTYENSGSYTATATVFQQGAQETFYSSWLLNFGLSEIAPEITTSGGRLVSYFSDPTILNGSLVGSDFEVGFNPRANNGVLRIDADVTSTGNPFLGSSGNLPLTLLLKSEGFLNAIGLLFTSDHVALVYLNDDTGLNPLINYGQIQPLGAQVFARDPNKYLELRFKQTNGGTRVVLAESDYGYVDRPSNYTILTDQIDTLSGFDPATVSSASVFLSPESSVSEVTYSELLIGGFGLFAVSNPIALTVNDPPPTFDERFTLTGGWNVPVASVGDIVNFTAILTPENGTIANTKLALTWPIGVSSASATLNNEIVSLEPEYDLGVLAGPAILSVTGIVNEPETQFATARATGFAVDPVEFTDELFSRGPQVRRIFVQANEPKECPTNLLDINEFKYDSFNFSESVGLWTNPDGDSILTNSRDQQKYSDISTMRLLAGVSGTHTIRSATYSLSNRWKGRESYLGVWIFVPAKITVDLNFVYTVGSLEETQTTSHVVRPSTWTWIDIQGPNISETQRTIGRLDVIVNGLDAGDAVYIAAPVFTSRDMLMDNPLTPEIWRRLPEYYREADGAQTDPTYPLLRFIDVAYGTAGQIEYIWDQIRFRPLDADGDGTLASASKMVNPVICCPQYLPWLAELLGVKLQYPSTGFTAWDDLAYTFRGSTPTPLEDWDDWESEPDTIDAGTTVEWEEIEDFNPFPSQLTDYVRWQVSTAYFGLRGGTGEAIKEAAKQVLKGTRAVRLTKHALGDPWKLLLETLSAETPDVELPGGPSGAVLKAIENAIPAGHQVIHVTVEDFENLESPNYGGSGIYGGATFDY